MENSMEDLKENTVYVNGNPMSLSEFQQFREQIEKDKTKKLIETNPHQYRLLERMEG